MSKTTKTCNNCTYRVKPVSRDKGAKSFCDANYSFIFDEVNDARNCDEYLDRYNTESTIDFKPELM